MSASTVAPILSQGVGYGVVIGIGAFFTALMACISWAQNRYTRFSTKTSEEFNTASRSIKLGLIACGVVSAWTWAATLLQSATVAYQYGISGPFWYAAGATVQIFMFSVLAVKVKQNAPMCHTFLEIVYKRYGAATHWVFILFALATNILVASQLLLGGSAVVTALTGMNVYAAVFLIPTGVGAYVVLGGLRATFLCDYSHTLIVMIIILCTSLSPVPSTRLAPLTQHRLYVQRLHQQPSHRLHREHVGPAQRASELRPVEGSTDGSYLTLKSNGGLIFAVIQLCSGMGTVFLDQGYWQRAIASRPKTAVQGYILGGFAWFAIPFGFATTLGLAAVALTDNPAYPTYPNEMSPSQISSGLSAAFGAAALLGKNGSIALLITLFMAVTSSSSSELIAVSSILTFDIYKTYVKPKPTATPKELIFVSHVMICFFGLVMAAFACIWNAVGVNLGWLFLVMGLIIGGAVFPAAFTLCWRGQTKVGAIAGCLGGLTAGVVAWLVQAHVQCGELSVASTGASYPTLAGNMAAVLTGLVLSFGISIVRPDDFDFTVTRTIGVSPASTLPSTPNSEPSDDAEDGKEKAAEAHEPTVQELPTALEEDREMFEDAEVLRNPHRLQRTFHRALILSVTLSLTMDFVIPMPMFFSRYVFSRAFFLGWIVVSFLWVFFALFTCGILPIVETRRFWALLYREIFSARKGKLAA
ncbi:hypothetical protein LTR53_011566 [Teratosphaeriaceae sp. CCFEE 6253]|nr:hypothetical protein LTR53_011566 [Teratosphaeriaceae sp. CCFEE 6253]